MKIEGLQKMSLDAYNKTARENYSVINVEDAIRNAVIEACGGDWNPRNFLKNQHDVFAIVDELMPVAINASLAGKYDGFAEIIDEAVGDKTYFEVEDNTIWTLYSTSRGNQDIERRKLTTRKFKVDTQPKGIKMYDEFSRFLTGKMDFARLTTKIMQATEHYVGQLISDTIYGSYSAVDTDFKATGAERVQIWGDTTALSSVADGFGYSSSEQERANARGYWSGFRGCDLMALPQSFLPGTHTLAVNDSHLIILPAGERIVKVAFEGTPFTNFTDGTARNDMTPEITYLRNIGAAALTIPEGKYGFYKLS